MIIRRISRKVLRWENITPAAALVIFVLAFLVRIYRLDIFSLNHDEATWSLRSLDHFNRFAGIPVTCFDGYIQPFFTYLVFLTNKIFSSPAYTVRLPAVIVGTGTVIVIYELGKEMYGKKAGVISSLFLCFLPWHVIQSRIGVSLILTPFFGCLIFLALLKSIHKKSNLWFLLSIFLLAIGSFYTYQVCVLFLPISLFILLYLRRSLPWLSRKIVLASVLLFLIALYPLIHLQLAGRVDFLGSFYRGYHQNPFKGNILVNLFNNFRANTPVAFKTLFLASQGRILYGAAFTSALLIAWPGLFLCLASLIISLWRRKVSDKILLIWLGLGWLGALSGLSGFEARQVIILLPVLLILIGRFITWIFDYAIERTLLKRRLLYLAGALLSVSLVFAEGFQLAHYYRIAPFDLEECRRNSYGCEEAAQYLSQIPDIRNCRIISDTRMTVDAYHSRYLLNRSKGEATGCVYYVLWAPESHPEDYWGGLFTRLYRSFQQRHPDKLPIKTICYPHGPPAIHIFKVEKLID